MITSQLGNIIIVNNSPIGLVGQKFKSGTCWVISLHHLRGCTSSLVHANQLPDLAHWQDGRLATQQSEVRTKQPCWNGGTSFSSFSNKLTCVQSFFNIFQHFSTKMGMTSKRVCTLLHSALFFPLLARSIESD